jgi:hypothetical protein
VKFITLVFALFALALPGFAEITPQPNWTGKYAPCNRNSELLRAGHMNLGIRISTSNAALAAQFERALDFWSSVVDLEWHNEDSQDCSIHLVDGTPALFDWCACTSARSQLPDRPLFQGLVAFNPQMTLSKDEMFLDSVHEIGHLLGLSHNSSESSIMFYFGLSKFEWVESSDLNVLSSKHALKPGFVREHGFSRLPVVPPSRSARGWFNPATWIAALP